MREILSVAEKWAGEGRPFAIATVVATRLSSPRELGASMIVGAEGEVFGNVSGGCVEGAVYDLCLNALHDRRAVVESYGFSDETAFSVGLTCGGVVDVLVRPIFPDTDDVAAILRLAELDRADVPAALGIVVSGAQLGSSILVTEESQFGGAWTDVEAPLSLVADVRAGLVAHSPRMLGYDDKGCSSDSAEATRMLVLPFSNAPRLIIVGAVEFSVALARLGSVCGFDVTVVDARPVFTDARRFPEADRVVVQWPDAYLASTPIDERTAICVLSHDSKFDVPAIRTALSTRAGYIGAMGSRRTHEDRLDRLEEAGIDRRAAQRVHSPIGLALGGRSPEETALSILAEIIAVRHDGRAVPLSESTGSIHKSDNAIAEL